MEECAIPYGLKCIGDVFGSMFPPVWLFLYGLFVAGSMQLTQEVEARQAQSGDSVMRGNNHEGRYLAEQAPSSNGMVVFSPYAPAAPVHSVPPSGYARVQASSAPEYEMGSFGNGIVVGTPVDQLPNKTL